MVVVYEQSQCPGGGSDHFFGIPAVESTALDLAARNHRLDGSPDIPGRFSIDWWSTWACGWACRAPQSLRPELPIIGNMLFVGKNTSFSLDDHYSAFIDEEVASGRYRSASDVVRTALRLLEDRETRLHALRQALIAGEQSGESTPYDFDEFVLRKRTEEPRHR